MCTAIKYCFMISFNSDAVFFTQSVIYKCSTCLNFIGKCFGAKLKLFDNIYYFILRVNFLKPFFKSTVSGYSSDHNTMYVSDFFNF